MTEAKNREVKTFHFNQNKSFHLSQIKKTSLNIFFPQKLSCFNPTSPIRDREELDLGALLTHCIISLTIITLLIIAHDKRFQLQPWVIGLSLISFIHAEFPCRWGIWHFSIPPCAHLKYGSLYRRKWASVSVSELGKEVLAMDQAFTHTAQYSGYVISSKGRMNIQTNVSFELRIIFHRQ